MLTRLSLKKSFNLVESSSIINLMLVAWVVTMISLPIVRVAWAETGVQWGIVAGVLLQAGVVVLLLYHNWGPTRTLWSVAGVAVLTWSVEFVGSATGLPFGVYHYTDKLQPQLAHVPLLIPLAWLMMLPPAWAVAYQLTGTNRGWTFVAVSALALTAWDLFLDPQMVAWGLWVWEKPSGYFGIPWSNYFGWLLASSLITVLVRPQNLPVIPLLLIYTITWVLETIGLFFFWGLPGPALVGSVAMGSLAWLAWSKHREKHR